MQWSSFVRQLNTYGFKKIQGVHQGSLIEQSRYGDNDNNAGGGCYPLEYSHIYFKKGQPELIYLIERNNKKSSRKRRASMRGVGNDDDEGEEGSTYGGLVQRPANQTYTRTYNTPPLPLPPPGPPSCGTEPTFTAASAHHSHQYQEYDLQQQLAALLQHQHSLSSDLTTLSHSLQETQKELYQQRIAMSKMAKFITGAFGHGQKDSASQDDDTAVAVVPQTVTRTYPRLMIEATECNHDGNEAEKKSSHVEASGKCEIGSIYNSSASSGESIYFFLSLCGRAACLANYNYV